MAQKDTAVVRPGVRVLVIDAAERVLLFASRNDAGERFWFPPGGGREPGETAEETARRELREETGLSDVELGPEIGRRRHVVTWSGVRYDLRERWFLARTPQFRVDTSGFTELERSSVADHRWWPLDELANATDRLVPHNLAELVSALLRDGPPARPIVLDV